jgi:lipopolysaccharide biosynthesis glycosyltransferase
VNVGFYHDGPPSAHAAAMVASVSRVMPGTPIFQFSPEGTATMKGVTRIVTPPQPLIARAVLEAYASVTGEWLFLDTDVLVLQNVEKIFVMEFDVAVAERRGTYKPEEERRKFMARMPWNKGVVYSRSQPFWEAAVARIGQLKESAQAWMGDQQAVCDVVASGAFHVATLANTFNYPPQHRHDGADKHVLHFKGPRKPWMLTYRRHA